MLRRGDRPVPVVGDPERLAAVVTRLLDNAIRYSPDGGPIHVGVGIDSAAAVCRVIDRGVGIAERDLPTLFTPFGRIANGHTDGVEGSGLSLHLSRELVVLHGGDIAVESSPGVGTSFSLALPCAGAEPAGTYDVSRFGLGDLVACGAAFRKIGAAAASFDDAATGMVRHLRESLRTGGEPGAALVRLFHGLPLRRLDGSQRARIAAGLDELTLCLVLAATCGEREEWNYPLRSAGHCAIGLPAGGWWPPMFARLVRDLDVDPTRAGGPEPFADRVRRTCNVFHVEDASCSPDVPAQTEFVRACGIRSALGLGGVLAPCELYAIVVFSKGEIPRSSVPLFRALSHSATLALRRFAL